MRCAGCHLVSADPTPPPAAFIATSGGIFRDLLIHDFDLLRWLTGQEVVQVSATGSARGAGVLRRGRRRRRSRRCPHPLRRHHRQRSRVPIQRGRLRRADRGCGNSLDRSRRTERPYTGLVDRTRSPDRGGACVGAVLRPLCRGVRGGTDHLPHDRQPRGCQSVFGPLTGWKLC